MNDNDQLYPAGMPKWAWDIIEQHDLAYRTDNPLAAATVLLMDAAFDLKILGETAFRDQALSCDTRRHAAACAAMIEDALMLADLCPMKPAEGVITEDDDGTLTRTPFVSPET